VIGISGFAGSGKDFIHKHYLKPQGFKQISLSWHFKADLIGKKAITFEEAFVTKPPEVRTTLQIVGTEVGRKIYGDDVWCNTLKAWMEIFEHHWGIDQFCIPDVRFWSEMDFIQHDLSGYVIRVKAPNRSGHSILDSTQKAHASEAEMLEMEDSVFDGLVFNDEEDPDMDLQLYEIFQGFGYDYKEV